MRRILFRVTILFIVLSAVLIAIGGIVFLHAVRTSEPTVYGVTFSKQYAEYLDIDWKKAYIATLDELKVRDLRIPIAWSEVEQDPGIYDFSAVEWMLDEAEKRGARVTLVVGMKVPRWPECYVPDWAVGLSKNEFRTRVVSLVSEEAERFKDHPALSRWQVENEPFFPYGDCPKVDAKRFYGEVQAVRTIDPVHPIMRTTSGEQSIWLFSAKGADVIGASLYRVVANPVLDRWVFPIPAVFYSIQSISARALVNDVIISELQAEPWLTLDPKIATVDRLYQLFTVEDLRRNVLYAQQTEISEIMLWGVEWWYYVRERGDDRLWNAAQQLFQEGGI